MKDRDSRSFPPTEIPGVVATEPGDEDLFRALNPYKWLGDAITMLAFAAGQGDVPQELKAKVPTMLYGTETVTGHASADAPLGPSQIAAAGVCDAILRNLADRGYVDIFAPDPSRQSD